MIKFSVIIPNYNHAAFLKERIESVLSQSYQDFELIILDDCSTDNSRDIIEEYRQHPKVSHIVYAEKNSGSPFKQWKKGIEMSRYDWIWIAESDDIAMFNFLEVAASKIYNSENSSLYFCNSIVQTTGQPDQASSEFYHKLVDSNIWQQNYTTPGNVEINRALKYHSTIVNASAVVFRKSLLNAKANSLEKFKYYGDWYAYIEILSTGNIIYNYEKLNIFRRTNTSHSLLMKVNDKIKIKEECFKILDLLLEKKAVLDKKKLIDWYVKNYVGFGLKSDGFKVIINTIAKYYSINFKLATKVIIKSLLLKLPSRGNT